MEWRVQVPKKGRQKARIVANGVSPLEAWTQAQAYAKRHNVGVAVQECDGDLVLQSFPVSVRNMSIPA